MNNEMRRNNGILIEAVDSDFIAKSVKDCMWVKLLSEYRVI